MLGLPDTVYRNLIDATEREVELVLVGGDPLAGDTELMSALKPRDVEVVPSAAGGFHKAVDVTTTAPVPDGDETLAQLTSELQAGLAALGGDNPPPGGGPGPTANTYSYLKAHVSGGAAAALPDPVFRGLLAAKVGVLPDGSLNLERVQLEPLFEADTTSSATCSTPTSTRRPGCWPTQHRRTRSTSRTSITSGRSATHSSDSPSDAVSLLAPDPPGHLGAWTRGGALPWSSTGSSSRSPDPLAFARWGGPRYVVR